MEQYVTIPDALNAFEKNVKAFLEIAGHKPGYIIARVDPFSGTASIKHTRNPYTNAIDVEIYFPAMKAQARLTVREMNRWIGYFLHELCHALYTAEDAWKAAVAERLHVLVNAMEDVRIERKFNASGIAANSKDILNALLAWAVSEIPAGYDPNDMKQFPWLLAMVGRVEVCGYDLPEAQAHIANLSPGLRQLVSGIMADISKANDTWAILEIARQLKKSLTPGDKPKGNKPDGEKGDKPDSGTGDGEKGKGKAGEDAKPENCSGEDAGEDAASEGVESDSSDPAPGDKPEGESRSGTPQKPENGKPEGKAGSGGESSGSESEITADIDDMNPVDLKPDTTRMEKDAKALRQADAIAEANVIEAIREANKQAAKPLKEVKPISFNINDSIDRLNAQASRCATLRSQVARVLKAEESETWERGKASGRIDRFAYGRIVSGITDNVFAKRTISGGYETEISVLVDASGSMAGSQIWAATVLAYVIAQAAQQVGVKCEVIRFHSFTFQSAKGVNATPSNRETQKAFARMGIEVGGSTPLSQSMIKTSARLALRAPHKRKMLFVVSDGMDDGGPQAVKAACAYAESLGVETVALCIGVPVHAGFRHGVTCDAANIQQAGLGKLVQVLERSA